MLTYPPTFQPTIMQTTVPTVRPTEGPTVLVAPTPSPSKQRSNAVTFQSNFTIAGVAQPFLDYDASEALAETTAATLGFPGSTCSVIGARVLASAGRRFIRSRLEADFTLVATVQTTIALSETSYSSVDALYNNATTTLQRQVENGVFTANLRVAALALGASDLYSADVKNVTVSPAAVVQGRDNQNSSDGLSGGAVVGIVLGGLCAILVGGYCVHQQRVGAKDGKCTSEIGARSTPVDGDSAGAEETNFNRWGADCMRYCGRFVYCILFA
jgi:hypothetical protein